MSGPTEFFPFPPDFEPGLLPTKDNKVCVVSIVGKSRYSGFSSKASILNPLLDKDIFRGEESFLFSSQLEGNLECYYHSASQVIYLHYKSIYDTYRLSKLCEQLTDNNPDKEFHSIWQDDEFQHAKTLLLMFCVSHIIVLNQPGTSFDINLVRLFRTLDNVRLKLQSNIIDQLQGLPISKDWFMSGRLCSPRVLFVFEGNCLDTASDGGDSPLMSKSRSQKAPPLKRLQHSIEDQIYRILRKSRVITNISNNSLFAVPANQEFVYIQSKRLEVADPSSYYIQQLKNICFSSSDADPSKGKIYNQTSSQAAGSDFPKFPASPRSGGENTFQEFLMNHIDLALSKGFDDNVGRLHVQSVFELPTCGIWFTASIKLYHFFFTTNFNPESKIHAHMNTLKSLLDIDTRFSENRCNKVLPIAESAYQEGLPPHYTTSYHLTKLQAAKRVFAQFARGPAFERYSKQLEESCETFWKNGHRLCEEISLTGNHCVNALHRILDLPQNEENEHLPVMAHSSQLKTKAACNCGKKQAEKEDPFDHRYANHEFYENLEKLCCNKLEHIELPFFKPSTEEARAVQMIQPVEISEKRDTDKQPEEPQTAGKEASKSDIVTGMSNLSLALSLGQSGSSDIYGHHERNSLTSEQPQSESPIHEQELTSQDTTEFRQTDTDVDSAITIRQHSTTEYLPGMIHSDSPPGLLPKFSSWSLCCVAKATFYSHTQGLDLPGFLHGSNYLLPWDITVKTEKEKWPTIGETKKGKPRRAPKDAGELNVRAYIGDEYECPRGHRFFCSSPEKIIKVSSTSCVKDNATRLLTLDMPLYCPCHCRSPKGYMAQLLRLYIVTPDSPVRITVYPKVQPGSSCPNFHIGTSSPVELGPNGVWCLRLPHIYLGDHGPYRMPSDPHQLSMCRLLKGVFGYKEPQPDS